MSRRGFTMIEVLVAGGLMVIVLAGVYRLWSLVARGGTTEAWASTATARLSTADARLRELIIRAGFPSMMTSQGLKTPSASAMDSYRVQVSRTGLIETELTESGAPRPVKTFNASGSEPREGGTAMISFLAVTPGSAGIEGKPASSPTGARVRIMLSRGHRAVKTGTPLADLTLEEAALGYPATPSVAALPDLDAPPYGPPTRRELVPDVTRVRVSAVSLSGGMPVDVTASVPVNEPCTLRIEVDCLEPYHGARRVMRTIVADTHAGLTMDGTP